MNHGLKPKFCIEATCVPTQIPFCWYVSIVSSNLSKQTIKRNNTFNCWQLFLLWISVQVFFKFLRYVARSVIQFVSTLPACLSLNPESNYHKLSIFSTERWLKKCKYSSIEFLKKRVHFIISDFGIPFFPLSVSDICELFYLKREASQGILLILTNNPKAFVVLTFYKDYTNMTI